MSKATKFLVAVAAVGFLAAGCTGSAPPQNTGRDELIEVQVPLSDGRTVTCVKVEEYRVGGLSCDWQAAR